MTEYDEKEHPEKENNTLEKVYNIHKGKAGKLPKKLRNGWK